MVKSSMFLSLSVVSALPAIKAIPVFFYNFNFSSLLVTKVNLLMSNSQSYTQLEEVLEEALPPYMVALFVSSILYSVSSVRPLYIVTPQNSPALNGTEILFTVSSRFEAGFIVYVFPH